MEQEISKRQSADPLDMVLRLVPKQYKVGAEKFAGYLRDSGASLADPEAWKAYLRSLDTRHSDGPMKGRKYSAASYNQYLAAMKATVRIALESEEANLTVAEKYTITQSLDHLKSKKKPDPGSYIPEKVMTAEEVLQLIRAAQEPSWGENHQTARPEAALWIEFLWATGVRISEMINIMLTDLQCTNAHYRIRIMGKGSKERFIEVPQELVERCQTFFKGQIYLFESRNRGKGEDPDYRFHRNHISSMISRIGWAVLQRRISAHALRHSIATHLYKRTHNPKGVQNFLGHSNISTTLSYYVHDNFGWEDLSELTRLDRLDGHGE